MPRINVFSVRDRIADVFGRPFFVPTVGQAIRSFGDALNSTDDNEMVKHPDDFDLFHLGEFDDETGIFECLTAPKQVAVGKDLKIKPV